MKQTLLLISLLFVSLGVFARQAPKVVTDAFQQKFNGASNVKWEKETEKGFDVSFDLLGKKMSANFNGQGQWQSTSTLVGLDGLPAIARVVLQTRFINWDIATAYKIEKADSAIHYQANLVKDKVSKEILIKPDGVIIKQ